MKKAGNSKEKTMKNTTIFMQNKANLSGDKFSVRHLSTRIYERFHPLAGQKNKPNQTQFKAKTNPIRERQKMNTSIYHTKVYNNKTAFRRQKNKPKQTQLERNASPELVEGNKFILECRSRGANFKRGACPLTGRTKMEQQRRKILLLEDNMITQKTTAKYILRICALLKLRF